ncbi:hypothetical protein [Thermofilum pendens]|uniref:hypothetical protein n=1 Tax=Thermofilum pendens TaxID=2269 RepID=UPI0011E53139|nr:hypothetical protein [Thermofilum pendens]
MSRLRGARGEPPSPAVPSLTPSLVSAAYKRALRLGTFWRLSAEERALLKLAGRLKAIKSPLLKEQLLKILEKVWPEKAKVFKAFEEGLKQLSKRIQLALKIGALAVAEELSKAGPQLVLHLGLAWINTPPFYRGEG